MKRRDYTGRTAHFIGGGLASLAGAAYLIRDCKFPGSQITVYEGMHILGGSMMESERRKAVSYAAAAVC